MGDIEMGTPNSDMTITCDNEIRKQRGVPSKKIAPLRSGASQWLSKAMSVGGANLKNRTGQKKNRMLTYSELSDLFRRLDKDGSGSLDLEEFAQIITKLKIVGSEEYVAE